MRFPSRLLGLITLVNLLWALPLQAQVETKNRIDNPVFTNIDQAYQNGELSRDQKVRYKMYAATDPKKLPPKFQSTGGGIIKCGTPAHIDYQNNKKNLSPSTKREIESLLQSPSLQALETYRSSSGRFQIYYEANQDSVDAVPPADANSNNIPDYVEEVAAAADSSYRHEVVTLGYTNPIPTGATYVIKLRNLQNIYGQTITTGGVQTKTLIEIENDFAEGFPSNDDPDGDQLGAAKATVAHELKHAIQYEANGWDGETFNWLEMDATLMEEVVYDTVNDYYNYIQSDESIFNNPQDSFYPGTYFHVSWALFFEEKYGPQFWPQVWQAIKQNPQTSMVAALSQILQQRGETFSEAYIESQLWHFASGAYTNAHYGFEEAAHYPTPDALEEPDLYSTNFSIPNSSQHFSVADFSANYYTVPHPQNVSGDIILDIASSGENKGIGIIAYYSDGMVATSILNLTDNESTFKMPNLNWPNLEQLGLVLTNSTPNSSSDNTSTLVRVGSDRFDNSNLNQNYPNPFNPQTTIRFTLDNTAQVELQVFDSSGRLVQTLIDREMSAGLHETIFNGSNLASGVYFYRLQTNQQTFIKKMTLIK